MPVSQTKVDPRTLVLVAASFAIVAIVGVVLFVVALPSLNDNGKAALPAKTLVFQAGPAPERATAVADGGPLLFSDVGGGLRDIYLQHGGTEPLAGWTAFDARFPGSGRECTLQWDRGAGVFREPAGCPTQRTVPADGAGLPTYPVTVTSDNLLEIDLDPDARRAPSTGTSLGA